MHTYTHSQSQLENTSNLNISKEQFTIAKNEQTESSGLDLKERDGNLKEQKNKYIWKY